MRPDDEKQEPKTVQVRPEIRAFAQNMEQRARYGHGRVVAEEVMAAKFMSVQDMLDGVDRNLFQVKRLEVVARQRQLSPAEFDRMIEAVADSSNYLRMTIEKIKAAQGEQLSNA